MFFHSASETLGILGLVFVRGYCNYLFARKYLLSLNFYPLKLFEPEPEMV